MQQTTKADIFFKSVFWAGALRICMLNRVVEIPCQTCPTWFQFIKDGGFKFLLTSTGAKLKKVYATQYSYTVIFN